MLVWASTPTCSFLVVALNAVDHSAFLYVSLTHMLPLLFEDIRCAVVYETQTIRFLKKHFSK